MPVGDDKTPAIEMEHKVTASMKLPPFWAERPELWFAQIEAMFVMHRITSDMSKFNYIIANLDTKVLQYIPDAVTNPPADDKYSYLKNKMIECFAESGQTKIQKLLSELHLGDKKPSQLLSMQKELAGSTVNQDFLKTLWLRQLHISVQTILTVSSGGVDDLAKLADKIMEVNNGSNIATTPAEQPNTTIQTLEAKIDDLTKRINQLQHKSRSRSNSRVRFRARSSTPAKKVYDHCWYHFKFGEKANKCIPPCKFTKNA